MNKSIASDTIYRQDAVKVIDKHIDTLDVIDTNYLDGLRTAMNLLNDLPSAQLDTAYKLGYQAAVKDQEQPEIIRCKDCKHRPIETFNAIVPPQIDDWKCPCLCDDYFYSWRPKDDFFCANGERKEEWI